MSADPAADSGPPPVLEVTNAPPRYQTASDIPSRFGKYGGRFIPETLMEAHTQLEEEYVRASNDPEFRLELEQLGRDYVGRPTPMYLAKRLTAHAGGAQIWIKREDLAHTGAHKINNALGQALLARKLGKRRIIAETGAGQHGVATATACALLGLDCVVYMGEEDCNRQSLNVFRMKMMGAEVVPVKDGSRTLKDAVNAALRDWVTNVETTVRRRRAARPASSLTARPAQHYIIGSAIGPHPFPSIVRDFQSVIGRESRAQLLKQAGKLPDAVVACVGGGSNAIGMFAGFFEDADVRLVGVEAAGSGVESGKHSATLSAGRPGVLHGTRTYLLQSADGQITETHSISAGLDYPGVGPEHAHLKDSGRAQYVNVTDDEALEALQLLSRIEGIVPALETAHAVHYCIQLARSMRPDQALCLCLSGRGDKDMIQVAKTLGVNID